MSKMGERWDEFCCEVVCDEEPGKERLDVLGLCRQGGERGGTYAEDGKTKGVKVVPVDDVG